MNTAPGEGSLPGDDPVPNDNTFRNDNNTGFDAGSPEPGPGTGEEFSPQEAAALLAEAGWHAKRQFNANSLPLSLSRAFVTLAAYGALWFSVRGQHPYQGPSPWALPVVYLLVAIIATAGIKAQKRATQGVSGKSQQQRRSVIAAMVVVWIATYVFMGSLRYLGVSHAIVYGVYPAIAPLLIPGAAAVGYSAAREDWSSLSLALGAVCVGAISPFAGPVGVWGVAGVSMCAVLLAHTAVTEILARRQRSAAQGPVPQRPAARHSAA